jgi:hypothetical protein
METGECKTENSGKGEEKCLTKKRRGSLDVCTALGSNPVRERRRDGGRMLKF